MQTTLLTKWQPLIIVSLIALMSFKIPPAIAGAPLERTSAETSQVQQILERYIAAIGGREAIQLLTSRVCIGKEVTDLTSREKPVYESVHFEAYSRIPDNYRTESWSDAGTHQRGFDGVTGWKKDRCGVVADSTAKSRRLDWLLNPHNALIIENYFPDLVYEGYDHILNRAVHILSSPAIHRPLFFDAETGLLIGFGYNWLIHDYRRVDGILFPHRIHLSRKGGSTEYIFDSVEHNIEFDDAVFAIPGEIN